MNTVYPERTVFMEPRPRGNDEWWRVQWASGRPQFFDLSTSLFLAIHGIIARSSAPTFSIGCSAASLRSEEHTSELQSLMRISYAVFCLKKKKDLIEKYTCHNPIA